MFKSVGVGVLILLLISCGAWKSRPGSVHAPLPAAPPELSNGARVYHIDTAQSELRVLVYRAGPLARFGHNHVIVNRSLTGWINRAGDSRSSLALTIPVADFVVDDAQARAAEGPDFPGEVPDDAKAGTLRNMLGAALLDVAEYPLITVQGSGVIGNQGALVAALALQVAGRESKIEVPFTLESNSQRLAASGMLDLRQSDMGLTPFSLMLGALQVQDSVRLKFKIVAVAR